MFLLGTTFVEVLEWIGYVLAALLCLMFIKIVHEIRHNTAGKILKIKIKKIKKR